jgi:hypothetical protein
MQVNSRLGAALLTPYASRKAALFLCFRSDFCRGFDCHHIKAKGKSRAWRTASSGNFQSGAVTAIFRHHILFERLEEVQEIRIAQ